MKKVYVSPELELLKLDLTCDVLAPSFETGQSETAFNETPTFDPDELF